jgi:hypothetical protein
MSGNRLVLDTNIVLGFLAGRTDTTSYLNGQQGADLYVSTVTRMELLSFPTITPEEEQAVNEFLDCVTVMPLDDRIEDIGYSPASCCTQQAAGCNHCRYGHSA